jgi:PGF-CTERM protein
VLRTPVVAAFSLGLAALLALPLAVAQDDEDGCTNREPCPLIVDVDQNGFYLIGDVFYGQPGAATHLDFTLGDWYTLTVDSMDPETSHTVSLSGHGVSVTVGPDGFAPDSEAFEFGTEGTFKLRDEPSGDEFEIRVVDEDVSATGSGSGSDGEKDGIPGFAPLALVAALAVALLVLRRR